MKIVVIGTRGFPRIMGGVETHCEELFTRIAGRGHDVTVIRRSPYINHTNRIKEYNGVKLIDVYAPKIKSAEAIVHTFLSIIKAKKLRPDILHVHAIGPSVLVPFAKMLGLNVVVTNHGPDYNRQKWGRFAKFVLRTGEKFGSRFADRVIVISHAIAESLAEKYARNDTDLIFNGVNPPPPSQSSILLQTWGLEKRKYIFAAGRFVKEKGFHDLIDAFKLSGLAKQGYRLVIAGDADHDDDYSRQLKMKAKEADVVLTGFIKGEPLSQLMANAALFVIPSYHEGLPITLLEAMSFGIDVLASDIRANSLPELDASSDFFPTGNVNKLSEAILAKISNPRHRNFDLSAYDWDNIADQTIEVYKKVLN